jgi:hypothetical protein
MKKVILFILLFWTTIIYFSCTKGNAQANNNNENGLSKNQAFSKGKTIDTKDSPSTSATLFAANNINTGNVSITNDAYYIYVTYKAQKGYVLTETNLYIGANYLIPTTKEGIIMTDKFPYSASHKNEVSYTYQIPVLAIPAGTCGTIAAQAYVVKYNGKGKIIDQQTAWANGTAINKTSNAAMKFDYCSIAQ